MHPRTCRSRSSVLAATALIGSLSLMLAAMQLLGALPARAAVVTDTPTSARSVDVVGDDEADRFRGSGGLVLPGTMAHETRQQVARCADCKWRLADPCAASGDAGERAACMSVTRGCARSAQLLRVWFSQDDGATWRDLGLVCIPPGGPVTVGTIASAVSEEFERVVPAIGLGYQPSRGVLPYLPVVFHSAQPSALPPSGHIISGVEVTLYPRPTWTWDFGDGSFLTTSIPGSTYPDLTVSHTYARGGRLRVRVTTTWNASYMIGDLGPFQVAMPVTQTASAIVPVGQARAVLVP
jgi:hypothetical protein